MAVGAVFGAIFGWWATKEDVDNTVAVVDKIEEVFVPRNRQREGSVRVKSVKVGSGCFDLWNYHNVGVEVRGSGDSVWFPDPSDECSKSYDSCWHAGIWNRFCRIYPGFTETVNSTTPAILKADDILYVSAHECDGIWGWWNDNLNMALPKWNICGIPYELEVKLGCNWIDMSLDGVCVDPEFDFFGTQACLDLCPDLDAKVDLFDHYTVTLEIEPSKEGCTPKIECSASRLAHPSVELLALALVAMAFWR
jgi:hypothetical protein